MSEETWTWVCDGEQGRMIAEWEEQNGGYTSSYKHGFPDIETTLCMIAAADEIVFFTTVSPSAEQLNLRRGTREDVQLWAGSALGAKRDSASLPPTDLTDLTDLFVEDSHEPIDSTISTYIATSAKLACSHPDGNSETCRCQGKLPLR
jgi:hypothetical protein